tara:strand:+ start:524 stop:868 length:345 start_codon:yes stop_codon:yes gene_type:complete
MMEILIISCTVALIQIIWMHSDAFQEYVTLVGGNKFFLIDAFKKEQEKNPALDYISYLQNFHGSFFIRLITCPLCSSVWLTLLICFFSENLIVFPLCNILALVIYKFTIKIVWW